MRAPIIPIGKANIPPIANIAPKNIIDSMLIKYRAALDNGPNASGDNKKSITGKPIKNHNAKANRTDRTPNMTPLKSVGFAGRSITAHHVTAPDIPAASPALSGSGFWRGFGFDRTNGNVEMAPSTKSLIPASSTQNRGE